MPVRADRFPPPTPKQRSQRESQIRTRYHPPAITSLHRLAAGRPPRVLLGSPRSTDLGHRRVSAALVPIRTLLGPDVSKVAGDAGGAGRGPGDSALLLLIIDLWYLYRTSEAQKALTDVFFLIKKKPLRRPQ